MGKEPVPPTRLQPQTPGDLDTICLKCLAKEPAKRYASAESLADDLRRFRVGEPIAARPVGRLERGWRWCRRNPLVAASLVAVAAALMIGTGISALFAVRATASAETALNREAEAKASAAEARRQVTRLCVANGLRAVNDGDLFTGLLWFSEPLARDPDDATTEAMARLRVASFRRHSTEAVLTQIVYHEQGVYHASFSPDGRSLLTASADNTARVWDAATGRPLTPPLTQDDVTTAVFSADAKRVITTARDQTTNIWETESGQLLSPPLNRAVYFPDGRRLLTRGMKIYNYINIYLCYALPDTRPRSDLIRFSQLLSNQRIDFTGGVMPIPTGLTHDNG
jgi:hypothetical protein